MARFTRPWLSRVARLFGSAKQPARATNTVARLAVEAMEDRVVPASFTVNNAPTATLIITLATNETLTITHPVGANTVFTLGGVTTPTFTQVGGSAPVSNAAGVLTIADANLVNSVVINNAGAAAASTNTVTFSGTLTSANVAVVLTDPDTNASDPDNILLNTTTSIAATGAVSLQTKNGTITSNAAGDDITVGAGTLSLSATGGVGTGALPIETTINGGTLAAVATNGRVNVSNNAGGSVTIGTVAQTTSQGVIVPQVSGAVAGAGNVSVTNTVAASDLTVGTMATAAPVTVSGAGTITLAAKQDVNIANSTVSSASGNILLNADTDGAGTGDLIVGAPSTVTSTQGGIITLGGAVNDGTSANNVTINGTVTATGAAGSGNQILLNADNDVTVSGAVSVSGSALGILVNADFDADGAGVFGVTGTGSLTVAGGAISAFGTDVSLAGGVNAGATGTVLLNPRTAAAITLGAAGDATTFGLTDADLDLVTAGSLLIGQLGIAGGLDISGGTPITLDPTKVPTLVLANGGAITDSAGGTTPDITAQNLSLQSSANIGATGASALDLNVDTLAAATTGTGDVVVTNAKDLTLGNVGGTGGLTGVSAFNGNVIVEVDGTLTLAAGATVIGNTAGNDVTLKATGDMIVLGTITTSGAAGNTNLYVDNLVTGDGALSPDPDTAGGVLTLGTGAQLNSGVPVTITGANQADTFNVRPQSGVAGAVLNVTGLDPTTAPGDALNVDTTGTTGTNTPTGVGQGTITFTNGRANITYNTTETVDLATPPPTVVTVVATDPNAAETGADPGTFTITRTGSTLLPLTVNVTLSGTATLGGANADYTTTPATTTNTFTVTIPAGQASTTLVITPIDDTMMETAETVTLTVNTGTGYTVGLSATDAVTIADNDTPTVVTVVATDPNAAEAGTDPGTFTLTRTGDTTLSLTVNVTLTGTATTGTDYTTTPATTTTVTFAAGSATATVTVTPIDDAVVDPNETVILTVGTGTGYTVGGAASDTVTILDNDTASPPVSPPPPSGGGGTTTQPTTTSATVSGGNLVLTKSDGSKTTLAVPAGTVASVIGDINGNGGNDVLVILPNGTIAVVDGITGQLAAVAGLDFNGDGFKDVLLIAPSGAPRTFFDGKTGRSFSLGG